jgi:hypothetical protein
MLIAGKSHPKLPLGADKQNGLVLNVGSPYLNVVNPYLNVGNPKVNVAIPYLNVGNPKVNVAIPYLNVEN